jgi:hypothetical protein
LARLATDWGVTCVARGGDVLFSRQHMQYYINFIKFTMTNILFDSILIRYLYINILVLYKFV